MKRITILLLLINVIVFCLGQSMFATENLIYNFYFPYNVNDENAKILSIYVNYCDEAKTGYSDLSIISNKTIGYTINFIDTGEQYIR